MSTRPPYVGYRIQEKHEQLIALGKNRGYLDDELKGVFSVGDHTAQGIDNASSSFDRAGIDLYRRQRGRGGNL